MMQLPSLCCLIASELAERRFAPRAAGSPAEAVGRRLEADTVDAEPRRLPALRVDAFAEGAGAAPLAALLKERSKMAGKKVGLILSGGNPDKNLFARALAEVR